MKKLLTLLLSVSVVVALLGLTACNLNFGSDGGIIIGDQNKPGTDVGNGSTDDKEDAKPPETDNPSGDEPGGDEPGGDEPGGDEPGGDVPGGDEPGGDEPGGDEPGEHQHTPSLWITDVDSTCAAEGSAHKECTECHEVLDEMVISKLDHSFDDGVFKNGNECSANAAIVYTCAGCGATEEKTAESHAFVIADSREATCLEGGYVYYTCTVCSASKTEYTDALGHKLGKDAVTTPATCEENGSSTGICENCSEEVTVTLLATGHKADDISFTDDKCGEHKIGEIKCSACGITLESYGHDYVKTVTDLGCEMGVKTVYDCANCDSSYEEISEPVGHIPGEWTVATAASCKATGEAVRVCLVCGETCEREVIKTLDHVYTSAVNGANIVYTCACGDSYSVAAEDRVTVSFISEGEKAFDDLTVKRGETAALPSPVKEGYNFAGWYRDVGLQNIYTSSDVFNADTTLYAAWTPESVKGEVDTNNIITDVPLNFTFGIKFDGTLDENMLNELVIIEDQNGTRPLLKILSANGNEYTVGSDGFTRGTSYSVALRNGVSFTDTEGAELLFVTEDDNKQTIEYKDGIKFISESELYGALEEGEELFIIMKEDLLDPEDVAVVYGEDIYDVILILEVSGEGMLDELYVYSVKAANEDDVFTDYEVYFSGELTDYELDFNSELKEALTEEAKNSQAYREFEYAAKKLAATSGGKYKLKEIVVAPSFAKTGKAVTVRVLISAVFTSEGNVAEKTLEISLEFNTTLSFDLTAKVSSVNNFTFVLNTTASTRVDIYASYSAEGDLKRGTYDTMEYFGKLLAEAKEKGKFGGVDEDSASSKKNTTLGVLTLRFAGIGVEFEVANVLTFEVSGEVGVSISVNVSTSFGVKNTPKTGFTLIRSTKASSSISFFAMGKAELSALIKIKAEISLLGIVSARVEFAAGPYLLFGGMFTVSASTNGSFSADMNGYVELGVKIEATAGVSAKLSFKIFWKKVTIVLYDKTWELYSSKLVIFSAGNPKVPLYFTEGDESHTLSSNCSSSINVGAMANTEIYYLDVLEGGSTVGKGDCKFFFDGNAPEGMTLTEDGKLTIENMGGNVIYGLHIKAVCGDIYKIVSLTIEIYHNEVFVPGVSAGCESEGYSDYYKCDVCGAVIGEIATEPATGHNISDYYPDEEGYHVGYCSNPGCDKSEREACELTLVWTEAPTCTMGGYSEYYCEKCHATVCLDKTDPIDHAYETVEVFPGSCQEPAYILYRCSVCFDVYKDTTGEASGHSYTPTVYPPSCESNGYTEYVCSACGDSYTGDFVPANGHQFNSTTNEPTCTTPGFTYYWCDVCGYNYDGDFVGTSDHDWNEMYSESATCTNVGFTEYSCRLCGESKTEYGTELADHDFIYYDFVAAGCENAGYEIYRCDGCGSTENRNEVAAFGHEYTLESFEQATCTDEGYEIYRCMHCGDSYTKPLPIVSHNYQTGEYTEADCLKDGIRVLVCEGCGDSYTEIHTEALGHFFSGDSCERCGTPYYTEGLEITDCGNYAAVSGLGSFTGGELIIPESYNGLPVTVIYAGIFRGNTSITSLSIPGSVTMLDSNLFEACTAIERITIGEGMIEIGGYAFSGCTSLKEVTIPSTVSSLGNGVFYGCSALEKVELGSLIQNIGANAFMNCTALTEITLPENLYELGGYAFFGCSKLETVNNPSLISEIKEGTFYSCPALKSIDLSQIRFIGNEAFSGCSALSTVDLPMIESIGDEAFFECESLMNLYLSENLTSIGVNAFSYCTSITVLNIPNSVAEIPDECFYGCTSLSYISLGSVTVIGEAAFRGCSKLNSITLPLNITSIGAYAFYGCSALEEIRIPDGLETVNKYTFYGCKAMKSVYIPLSVTAIGSYAFHECSGLTAVYYGGDAEQFAAVDVTFANNNLPLATAPRYYYSDTEPTERGYFWHFSGAYEIVIWESANGGSSNEGYPENASEGLSFELDAGGSYYILTGIGDFGGEALIIPITYNGLPVKEIASNAFLRNATVTSIRIPDGILIRTEAFNNMQKLDSVVIGNYAVIEQYAFQNCYTMKSATVGEFATVADGMFSGCKALESANFSYGAKFGGYVFYGCTALTSFVIPDGTVSIGKQFFDGCTALVEVTIPKTLQHIGSLAFDDCTTLTVNYKGSESTYAKIYVQNASEAFKSATVNYVYGEKSE